MSLPDNQTRLDSLRMRLTDESNMTNLLLLTFLAGVTSA